MRKKKIIENLKIAVIGGAKSTLISLKTLKENNFQKIDVYYYIPKKSTNLIEYCNLKEELSYKKFRYFKFTKIQEKEIRIIKNKYDILLCVGLSQLISQNIINSVKYGCVGFHPTDLPFGKGRSAVAWNILNNLNYRVSFFKMDKKIDSGKVLIKSKRGKKILDPLEYYNKCYEDIRRLLILSFKRLINKRYSEIIKSKMEHIYCLRNYRDGFINFLHNKNQITKLIQASSYPHPGAYVCMNKKKYLVKIIKTNKTNKKKYYAEPGTILWKNNNNYLVMTNDNPVFLQINGNFRIGQRFLVLDVYEIYNMVKKKHD